MIHASIIQNAINELKNITKTDISVMEPTGQILAKTAEIPVDRNVISSFVESAADSQEVGGCYLFKAYDDGELSLLIQTRGTEEAYTIGKIAVSEMTALLVAYREKYDRTSFYQNLILDNMLLVDIYNQGKQLKIPVDRERAAIIVESDVDDNVITEILKGMFPTSGPDAMVSVEEHGVVIIKNLESGESYDQLEELAMTITDMMNTEAMVNVKVSYGTIVHEIKDVSKSYKEAKMALEVGKIFYADKAVIPYNKLGIGRLIYQLPYSLCEIFIKEYFGSDHLPEEIDEEILNTIQKFFENNLNISETSRQLYIHRNTLVYRIEKLQKATGLDMRVFEDALTFRIALMVSNYVQYLEKQR